MDEKRYLLCDTVIAVLQFKLHMCGALFFKYRLKPRCSMYLETNAFSVTIDSFVLSLSLLCIIY